MAQTYEDKPTLEAWNALAAAAAGAGNCRVVYGTYTGNGQQGLSGKVDLAFDGKPVFIFVRAESYNSGISDIKLIGVRSAGWAITDPSNTSSYVLVYWLSNNHVSWYGDCTPAQALNTAHAVYCYVALVVDE